jgi:hypothetical protein
MRTTYTAHTTSVNRPSDGLIGLVHLVVKQGHGIVPLQLVDNKDDGYLIVVLFLIGSHAKQFTSIPQKRLNRLYDLLVAGNHCLQQGAVERDCSHKHRADHAHGFIEVIEAIERGDNPALYRLLTARVAPYRHHSSASRQRPYPFKAARRRVTALRCACKPSAAAICSMAGPIFTMPSELMR